ncbi:hypothetical protein [Halomonas sp. S3-1-8]|uniref:hypothetical protein n=1 Tax=Halomonas sp. S3-1-8 TaxID=2986806 RepID=UPI003FA5EE49
MENHGDHTQCVSSWSVRRDYGRAHDLQGLPIFSLPRPNIGVVLHTGGYRHQGQLIKNLIGMNVFILWAVLPDVSTGTIFRGVTPFWVVDALRALLVLLFPALVLFLPQSRY